MSTLEDKILGEKLHYYCSSSEDEDNTNDDNEDDNSHKSRAEDKTNSNVRDESHRDWQKWDGYSVNTGPKGVIKDWQRYKQFESQMKENDEKEKLELMKKLSISCRSHLDEELAKKENQTNDDESDDMNDPFLKEYMIKRMQEMMEQIDSTGKERPVFGKLLFLGSGTEFLEAIDKEKKFVTIICHIFTNAIRECDDMNGCLDCLSQKYLNVKFCAIEAKTAGMSQHFSKSGVPALLVYKAGNLLANFVRLTDEFGDKFFTEDIEKFLVDHGILNETTVQNVMTRSSIRESAIDDDDSD